MRDLHYVAQDIPQIKCKRQTVDIFPRTALTVNSDLQEGVSPELETPLLRPGRRGSLQPLGAGDIHAAELPTSIWGACGITPPTPNERFHTTRMVSELAL